MKKVTVDEIQEAVRPLLDPEEELQTVIGAKAPESMVGTQYETSLSGMVFDAVVDGVFNGVRNAAHHLRVVAVTDRRILVIKASRRSYAELQGVERELPRSTKIGPLPDGKLDWLKVETLGKPLAIHRDFRSEVELADSAV